jgi:hypothetical protein
MREKVSFECTVDNCCYLNVLCFKAKRFLMRAEEIANVKTKRSDSQASLARPSSATLTPSTPIPITRISSASNFRTPTSINIDLSSLTIKSSILSDNHVIDALRKSIFIFINRFTLILNLFFFKWNLAPMIKMQHTRLNFVLKLMQG